ncbi:MAG: thiamine phosphate synthase [Pseudomonadota bacterium]
MLNKTNLAFPTLGSEFLGLYPIVNEYSQLKQLLPLGIKIIQLRIKDKQGAILEEQIQKSIRLASYYGTKLFINDYWALAIRYSAYGVHLGQSDLDTAPVDRLRNLGLRLGLSTHCHTELMRAYALKPSYIAYGPIFPTTSKVMSFSPQGIDKLKEVRKRVNCPLIAIGGIGLNQLPEILACGVDGIAVISAISQASEPVAAAYTLINKIDQYAANKNRN